MISVDEIVRDSKATAYLDLQEFLAGIPHANVSHAMADPTLRCFVRHIEHAARIWLGKQYLTNEVWKRKLSLLSDEAGSRRPSPYRLPVLQDLDVDAEGLVPLKAFKFDGSRLVRGGYAFTVLTTTRSANSTYWLLHKIARSETTEHMRVRLDPYLWGPIASFHGLEYKVWMYGRELDWYRLSGLQSEEHGRWGPESGEPGFTDYVWSPRESEVHFKCEEVPAQTERESAAARYLHAIYQPDGANLVHLDGALRLLDPVALRSRRESHVRVAGKVGTRIKIFRSDGEMARDALSEIAPAFFMWNEDVTRYFGSTTSDADQAAQ
jgi:hypothetical protein